MRMAALAAAAQALPALPRCKNRVDLIGAGSELCRFVHRAGYEGGKHQGGWGTENVIIPLGQGYLEIAAVFDPVAAQTCDWGKCVFYIVGQLIA